MKTHSLLKGLIHKSINANPESWRLFFNKYQIPTETKHPEAAIIKAYQKHGNVVVSDLNEVLVHNIAAFTGTDTEQTAVKIIGSWLGIGAHILSGSSQELTDEAAVKKLEEAEKQKEIELQEQKRKNRKTLIAFGAVCVIVIVVFIIIIVR